jgi:hypothetical protein
MPLSQSRHCAPAREADRSNPLGSRLARSGSWPAAAPARVQLLRWLWHRTSNAPGLALAASLLLGACGGSEKPCEVKYTVGMHGTVLPATEQPCLSRLRPVLDGTTASEVRWTVGTKVSVSWSCCRPSGWPRCKTLSRDRVRLVPGSAWVVLDESRLNPNGFVLEAVAPGTASVEARTDEQQLRSLVLNAVAPALLVPIVFEDLEGGLRREVDRLDLAPSSLAEIAFILRDGAGTELCGNAPLEVSLDAPLATITWTSTAYPPQTAGLFYVEAGPDPGITRATFEAQGLTAALDIHIAEP